MKHFYGYKIHTNFVLLTVWVFDKKTKALIGTDTCKPNLGLSQAERREVIRKKLAEEYGIKLK